MVDEACIMFVMFHLPLTLTPPIDECQFLTEDGSDCEATMITP